MASSDGDLGKLLFPRKARAPADGQAVESAFVPIMKTVISGVEVDLLFARINQPEAGDALDIEKDEILKGVDDSSQRSLNGLLIILNR
jgi:poly(A) polymerase Pap1